jgi:hypothetical protein
MEWDIRGRLADALIAIGVQQQEVSDAYSQNPDVAFDDVALDQIQQVIDGELVPGVIDETEGDIVPGVLIATSGELDDLTDGDGFFYGDTDEDEGDVNPETPINIEDPPAYPDDDIPF